MNRYAATNAPLDVAPGPSPALRKPVSVWITQILGLAYLLLPATSAYRFLRAFVAVLGGHAIVWGFLVRVGLALVIITLLVIMIVQMQRRSPVGRWLGVLFVAHFLLILVALSARNFQPSSGGSSQWLGYLTGWLLVGGTVAAWLYAIGFSRASRAWFTKKAQPADPSAPS